MKTAKVCKIYKPEVMECPKCNTKLVYCYSLSNKIIQFTSKAMRIKNLGYKCPNCNDDNVYFSETANKMSFKGYTYSSKALCMIHYYREKYSRDKVCDILSSKGIDISDRNIDIIYHKLNNIINSDYDTKIKEVHNRDINEFGFVRMSIDILIIEREVYLVYHDYFKGDVLAIWEFDDISSDKIPLILSKYITKDVDLVITARPNTKIYGIIKNVAPWVKMMSYDKV